MKIKEFKIGQKAKVKYNISAIRTVEADCIIIKAEDDRIYLDFISQDLALAEYFYEGQEIEVSLYTDKGIRVYDSIVLYSLIEGAFVIEYYEEVNKLQRREYMRINAIYDLILYYGKEVVRTKTINISGGGLRFSVKQEFIVGEELEFSLYLPQRKIPVNGCGKIIEMVKQENSSNYSIIEFNHIKEMDRSRIMRACFALESAEVRNQI